MQCICWWLHDDQNIQNILTPRSVEGTQQLSHCSNLVVGLTGQLKNQASISTQFFFFAMFRPALGPTDLSTPWVPGTLSPSSKWPRFEGDCIPPSSAELRMCEPAMYLSTDHNNSTLSLKNWEAQMSIKSVNLLRCCLYATDFSH